MTDSHTHAAGQAVDQFEWAAVGEGLASPVLALAVGDDGDGDALYAGGDFGLRKWTACAPM